MAKYYNRLDGEAREWASKNKHPRAERCLMVNGGKTMAKSDIEDVAGNGKFGFTIRRGRSDSDEVQMTKGLDGQFKKKRGTVARHRKITSRIWTSEQVRVAQMDQTDIEEKAEKADARRTIKNEQERETRRMARSENRNPKSRRGHKKKRGYNDSARE